MRIRRAEKLYWTHSAAPPLELDAGTSDCLLTKPLIHPETGGQVSAGGARDEKAAQEHLLTPNFPKLTLEKGSTLGTWCYLDMSEINNE